MKRKLISVRLYAGYWEIEYRPSSGLSGCRGVLRLAAWAYTRDRAIKEASKKYGIRP